MGRSSLFSGTLHDAGKSQEAGSGTGTEQGYPKGRSQPRARGSSVGKVTHRRDLDTPSVLASDFQQHRMKPSLGSVFAREGLKAPRCLWRRTGLGFVQNSTALVLSCSVWSLIKSGAKMEAKGKCPAKRTPQTGFLSLSNGPSEQDPRAQPWLEHQPFLPPCPEPAWLCFIHHSLCSQG